MPYVADASELFTTADNGLITFHQLPSVNYAGDVGSMTGLQILRVVVILVAILALLELALLLFLKSNFSAIPLGIW